MSAFLYTRVTTAKVKLSNTYIVYRCKSRVKLATGVVQSVWTILSGLHIIKSKIQMP